MPTDKLVVGVIGTGSRGVWDAGNFQKVPNVEIAYVCDVDERRRGLAAQKLGIDSSRVVTDMRKILDDKSVDAVIIATPDHWHSPAAILACDAGKHVYVEKPISHNIREGRLLVEAARAQQAARAARHAGPQHGDDDRGMKQLREGLIGDVLVAKCWNIQRRRTIGRGQAERAAGRASTTTTGSARRTMVPYQANRCHDGWHWWYQLWHRRHGQRRRARHGLLPLGPGRDDASDQDHRRGRQVLL